MESLKILSAVGFTICSVLANVVLSVMVLMSWPPRAGELANKHEWSILQVAGNRFRNSQTDQRLVLYRNVSNSGYDVAAIRSPDIASGSNEKTSRHLILTNAQNIPRLKFAPEDLQGLVLTTVELARICKELEVTDDVFAVLSLTLSENSELPACDVRREY